MIGWTQIAVLVSVRSLAQPLRVRGLVILACALCVNACGAGSYSAEPVQAWVVDKQTQRPIEGVIVVANWNLRWGFEGGSSLDMKILEASTDAAGRFVISGWGPEPLPRQAGFGARLKNEDPGLMLFHPSYKVRFLENSRPIDELGGFGPAVRKSEWTGKKIELDRLPSDDLEGRARKLDLAYNHVTSLRAPAGIAGAFAPTFCTALVSALEQFFQDNAAAPVPRTAGQLAGLPKGSVASISCPVPKSSKK